MSKRLLAACVGLTAALFLASIAIWHAVDTRPSSVDETKHLQLALDYRDWIVHHRPVTNTWAYVYPPFYHVSLIPALSVGRASEGKAALTHEGYLILLFVGLFLL